MGQAQFKQGPRHSSPDPVPETMPSLQVQAAVRCHCTVQRLQYAEYVFEQHVKGDDVASPLQGVQREGPDVGA